MSKRKRQAVVVALIIAYVASNVFVVLTLSRIGSVEHRVTRIERIIRVVRPRSRAQHHRRADVKPSRRTVRAWRGNRHVSAGVPSAGVTAPHRGLAAPTAPVVSSPAVPHHTAHGSTPASRSASPQPTGAPSPSASVTVPSQHVGPVTTPSVTVPVPAIPTLPHLP